MSITAPKLSGPFVVWLLVFWIVGFAFDLSGQEAEPRSEICADVGEVALWWTFDLENPEFAVGMNGVEASLTGTPSIVKGRVGRALELLEPGDGIDLESAGFPLGKDLTIEAWLLTELDGGIAQLIAWSSNEGGAFLVGLHAGRPFFELRDTTPALWIGDAFLSDGRWHHLGIVASHGDSLMVQILVDGDPVPQRREDQATRLVRQSSSIGGRGDRAFIGTLDEVTIHARALKRTEIVAIWAAGAGKCRTGF